MAVIHINGQRYEVEGGENLLKTCLSLGLDVPYFCYHPALGSAGSCRQCAVKEFSNAEDAEAGRGRIIMSCMVETKDNLYISVDDAEAKAFRQAMIELLMTNHPHDCPTCEEGGQCQLQDMTYMSGHRNRKYRFTKRTHNNQNLGPFINHEANRCIACYRCVRFYQNYAGGKDLGVFSSASRVFFGRAENGILESEFSGNLTEVCPTGVFTDKSHSERYNRKWDMQYSPSICQGCAVGCNISAGERYGELRRIENRFNGSINGYFLCDRGRFGYGFVNDKNRPMQPHINKIKQTPEQTIEYLAEQFKGKRILGIGSTTASLESNYQLKSLVGTEHFCAGLSNNELALIKKATYLQQLAKNVATIPEMEHSDFVLILGEDITQTAALIALSVRQAAKNKGKKLAGELRTNEFYDEPVRRITQDELSPIYIAAVDETKLNDIAQSAIVSDVDGIIDFAHAIILALKGQLPDHDPHGVFALANEVASALSNATQPLIISGTGLQSDILMNKAAEIAQLVELARLTLVVPDVNSVGIAVLAEKGYQSFDLNQYDAVIVMENNLDNAPADFKQTVLDKLTLLMDHQSSILSNNASIVLPAGTFAEADGTVISLNGQAQRYFQTFEPSYYKPDNCIKASWKWLNGLKKIMLGKSLDWGNLDDVVSELSKNEPNLSGIKTIVPLASFKLHDMKIAREPNRYSGRVAMRSALSVHEPKQPQDKDSSLAYSMEGYSGLDIPGAIIPFAWTPGWNSPQAWNKYLDKSGKHLAHGESGSRLTQMHINLLEGQFKSSTLNQIKVVPLYDLFASAPWREHIEIFDARERFAQIKVTTAIAQKLNIQDKQSLSLMHNQHTQNYIVVVDDEFADDCIGITMRFRQNTEGEFTINKEQTA